MYHDIKWLVFTTLEKPPTEFFVEDGTVRELTQEDLDYIEQVNVELAYEGLRVLSISYRLLPGNYSPDMTVRMIIIQLTKLTKIFREKKLKMI